ncbi:MAG TPA: tetratricopeptide repeat protein [Burkholderiaceae bacterium]|nr:tetratricopeptide repeat protein [Burkholderiaceae bacterium]
MSQAVPGAEEVRNAVELFQQGLDAQVVPAARELTLRYPQHGLGWMLLGASLKRQQKFEEALHPMQRAADLMPGRAELHSNLGTTYYQLGLYGEAERCYRSALMLQYGHADALFNLGRLQTKQDRFVEAAATFGLLVQAHPNDAEAHAELGIALAGLEQWIAAERCYRRSIELGHRDAVLFDHLSRALLEQGRPEEALAVMREALALKPESASLLGNFLFAWNHVPGPVQPGLPAEAVRLDQLMTAAASAAHTSWSCEAEPEVLRIGFVSGDFRRHPVGSFLASFIGEADKGALALYGYSTKQGEDTVTARLKTNLAAWRSLVGLTAAEAAARIAADGIHILIDLSGHTSHNRLDVFALSPAPVQVTWLGIPATTALRRIGFMLTDRYNSLAGDEASFSERLWTLPESWFCYVPLDPAPEVSSLPALANGQVTFGSFNSMTKINDAVVRTWAGILQAVPDARLVLRNWQLNDAAMVQLMLRRFAAHGIAADRLQLEGPIVSLADHLAQYGKIDIALDPFPFVGGTTSTEALFMGVPVLSMRGTGRMLRLGESLLQHVGLPEWIAPDEKTYVAKAVAFSSELAHLGALRAELRGRMQATSLLDGARFGRQFGDTLWALWREAGAPRM